jgi:hypothetical protein
MMWCIALESEYHVEDCVANETIEFSSIGPGEEVQFAASPEGGGIIYRIQA